MDTIKQKTIVVIVDGGPRIEVRRMRWKAAKEFYKKLSEVIASVYAAAKAKEKEAADAAKAAGKDAVVEGAGSVRFGEVILPNLPRIIAESDNLVTHLCTQSTSLTADAFDDLDSLAAIQVLDAAISTNLDDEIKNSFAGIGAKLAALRPAERATTN